MSWGELKPGRTIFDLGKPGRRGVSLPRPDVETKPLEELIPKELLPKLRERGFLAGVDLEPFGHPNALLIAVTEKRTRRELDGFVEALKEVAG